MKCSPPTARSLLIGIHGFRLLGGLIHLFSEVQSDLRSIDSDSYQYTLSAGTGFTDSW